MKRWEFCDGCDVDGICKDQKNGIKCPAVKRYEKWKKQKGGDKK